MLNSFFTTVGLEPPPLSVSEERHLAILTELPFVVPFEERVKVRQPLLCYWVFSKIVCFFFFFLKKKENNYLICLILFQIFQKLIYADKREVQGDGPFLDGINIAIRRNYIYEDAYDKLSPENGKKCPPQTCLKAFSESNLHIFYVIQQ